ncbi:hypothetical protein EI94DRAFT_1227187 [Lactarius quietus]|nr:hypothetical protein EI94DRAFT_1227187 [Lactarius quietus]
MFKFRFTEGRVSLGLARLCKVCVRRFNVQVKETRNCRTITTTSMATIKFYFLPFSLSCSSDNNYHVCASICRKESVSKAPPSQ